MSKIIIQNDSSLPDIRALAYVKAVMEMGRISNNDKQYCYLTTFGENGEIVVATDLNKKSDRFVIYDRSERAND